MLGGARLAGGRQAAERSYVVLVLLVGLLGDDADCLVQWQVWIVARGACVDLVVDVGDVAHVVDMIGAVEVPQQPEQHVEDDRRPRVADMRIVVNRRAADIHAHIVGVDRDEILLRACQRVVKSQAFVSFRRHKNPWPAGRGVCFSCREKGENVRSSAGR
jgi:hypothetical protein